MDVVARAGWLGMGLVAPAEAGGADAAGGLGAVVLVGVIAISDVVGAWCGMLMGSACSLLPMGGVAVVCGGHGSGGSAFSPLHVGWLVGGSTGGWCGALVVVAGGLLAVSMAGQARALSLCRVAGQVEETKHLLSATRAPTSLKNCRDNCMPWIRDDACLMRQA